MDKGTRTSVLRLGRVVCGDIRCHIATQFVPCVNRQNVNKFSFAYRPKAFNFVACHLFTLRSALGCCSRSSMGN